MLLQRPAPLEAVIALARAVDSTKASATGEACDVRGAALGVLRAVARSLRGALGRAVQVDPIKPTLTAPKTKRVKLEFVGTAFKFCFQIPLAPPTPRPRGGRRLPHPAASFRPRSPSQPHRVSGGAELPATPGRGGAGRGRIQPRVGLGRAVQVHPIKLTLKAPGIERSKLKYDELLSIYAFNFSLRRYSSGEHGSAAAGVEAVSAVVAAMEAGAHTRPPSG